MAITKPFTFVAGTKARANEVNKNFDVLYSEVNAIDANITSINVDIQSLGEDKANINGSANQRFQVGNAINSYDAVNLSQLNNTIPRGSIMMLVNSNVPDGYLECDGSTVSRTTYKDLFDVIGVTYGAGDGNLTFQLPDFRNKVPWGKDTETNFGYLEAGLPNIQGTVQTMNSTLSDSSKATGAFIGSDGRSTGSASLYASQDGGGNATLRFNASKSSEVYGKSTTVQPPSVKVIFIIKY